jgi:hypothetical protein
LTKFWTDKYNLPAGTAYGQSLIWNGTTYIPSPDPSWMITYVSPDGEDNANAGYDAAHPVKTIAYALTLASKWKRATQKRIKLLPGTYPESITITNDMHKASFLSIFADTLGTVTIGGQAWGGGDERTETVMAGNCSCKLSNLLIKPKTGTAGGQIVYAIDGAYMAISGCEIDASGASAPMIALYANTLGSISVGSTKAGGNLLNALRVTANGDIYVSSLTLNGNIAFSNALALANTGGRIHIATAIANTGTLSGGKRYDAYQNGDITGIANIPTSSLQAGTVATGGRAN